ncbi:MAG: MoaD/ThiS family protein [Oceanobacter sp.]
MIQVLLFARLRDEVGESVLKLELDSPCTVANIRESIIQACPQQARLFSAGQALVAINQTLTNDEQAVVTDKDEIAFFPPMTGG